MADRRDWKPRFLEVLRDTCNVRLSCRAVGIERHTPYAARKKSPEFARKWAEAIEDSIDVLEATARQRAIASSDYLLLALLKAHRPDVYRDTTRHLHGFDKLSDAELIARAKGSA